MKKQSVIRILAALLVLSALPLGAESLDKAWIISENTGNPATFVKLDQPNLDPGEIIQVYLEQSGLSAKWGEGWVLYGYSWFTDKGKKVWSSKELDAKKKTGDETWKLSSVVPVAVPADLPAGKYRIEFSLTDYHTKKNYLGNIHFTVGMGTAANEKAVETGQTAQEAPASKTQISADGTYSAYIGNVLLTLASAVRRQNKVILTFNALNEGDVKQELRIYTYQTVMIDSNLKEVYSDKWGSSGSLSDGHVVFPGVPAKPELVFIVPESFSSEISYLEIAFYSGEDRFKLKNLSIPYQKAQ